MPNPYQPPAESTDAPDLAKGKRRIPYPWLSWPLCAFCLVISLLTVSNVVPAWFRDPNVGVAVLLPLTFAGSFFLIAIGLLMARPKLFRTGVATFILVIVFGSIMNAVGIG